MTFGMPHDQSIAITGRALAAAAQQTSFVLIAVSYFTVVVVLREVGIGHVTPSILALVLLTGLLTVMDRLDSRVGPGLFIATGAFAVYQITATVLNSEPSITATDLFIFSTLCVPLIIIGGLRESLPLSITYAIVGFAAGQAAILAAALRTEREFRLDVLSTCVLVLTVAARVAARIVQRRVERLEPVLARLPADGSGTRRSSESRSEAQRDVLRRLEQLGAQQAGPLPEEARQAVAADARRLAELLGAPPVKVAAREVVSCDAVEEAISWACRQGLALSVLGRIDGCSITDARARALGTALRHVLANVLDHSGVDHADVRITPHSSHLEVTVTDHGRGFDTATVPPDRLGLRASIRGRIERVDGSVDVDAAQGSGTVVTLRVPLEGEPR